MGNYKVKIHNFLKDEDKKSHRQIVQEGFKCMIEEKEMPKHYLTRLLYKKNAKNYMDYMGVKKSGRVSNSKKLHNNAIVPILENKLFFDKYFSNTGLVKVPKVLGYNFKKSFYYNNKTNDIPILKNKEDIVSYITSLFEKLEDDSIFIKPIDGRQGTDCFKLKRENLNSEANDNIFNTILNGNFVFQETIKQHDDINQIYSGSINTIRIDTYTNDMREIHLLSASMRFGSSGNYVDNISAGGFFVPIDIETGKFKKYGMQLLEYGGNLYTEHPDTNFTFLDFKIPYFNEIKEMVVQASSLAPNKLVGWDVAISKKGPVIIEGNHSYSLRMSEMAYGGYKKHPVFKKIIKKYN